MNPSIILPMLGYQDLPLNEVPQFLQVIVILPFFLGTLNF